MLGIKRIRVRSYEKGLYFKHKEFKRLLEPGIHWFFDPLRKREITVVNLRDPYLEHNQLDLIVAADCLGEQAQVVQLQADERAAIWIDGRLSRLVNDGKLRVLWTTHRKVKVEVFNVSQLRLNHPMLPTLLASDSSRLYLDTVLVPEGHAGVYFRNGHYRRLLAPGTYAFWKQADRYQVVNVPLNEQALDISGQDIMTADKVTLRINAQVTYQVVDPERVVQVADDAKQALYREVQLSLRALIGTHSLDHLLADKEPLAQQLEVQVNPRAQALGLKLIAIGVRDIILPGDMKLLLNKVTEAKKAAEANLIVRREETAAMRSQANTAKLLENNPVLMRLRELEVLEKISANSKLNVMLGEKGLRDRIVNLL